MMQNREQSAITMMSSGNQCKTSDNLFSFADCTLTVVMTLGLSIHLSRPARLVSKHRVDGN